MRKKPEPIHYQIRRAILADPALSSTAKLVADVLLLDFFNVSTRQCNPSFEAIAARIGRCRRTVINAIKELNSGTDPWLIVKGTKGGSKNNTNSYELRMKGTNAIHFTGEADCTGAGNVGTGEVGRTEGVKQTALELSNELSRTIDAGHFEAAGPDRSLRRPLTGALRDPVRHKGTEVIQNRIAERLGSDGWNVLGDLPSDELERITQLERQGALADEMLVGVRAIAVLASAVRGSGDG